MADLTGAIARTIKRLMVGGKATDGPIWLPKLYAGLAPEFNRVNEYKRQVLAAAVPSENLPVEALDDLEGKYGIENYLGFTDQERINRIIERASGDGNGGADWLQEQIQQAGFPLYVIPNSALTRSMCDRGDCESATPPMVRGETVPVLYNTTWVPDATEHYQGTQSYRITKTIAAGVGSFAPFVDGVGITPSRTDMHGFLPGQTVTVRARVKVKSGGSALNNAVIAFNWYGGGAWHSNYRQAAQAEGAALDKWLLLEWTFQIPLIATGIHSRAELNSAADINEYFNVDAIQIDVPRADPASALGVLICSSPPRKASGYSTQYGGIQYSETIQYGIPGTEYSYPFPIQFLIPSDPQYWGRFFFLSPFADRLAANDGELLELTAEEYRYFRKLVIQIKYLRDWCIAQVKVV